MEVGNLYVRKRRKQLRQMTSSEKEKVWELIGKDYTLKEIQRDTNFSYGAINSIVKNNVKL